MRTGQHVAELACTMRQKGARIDAPCPVVTGNRHRQHVAGGTGQADARHRLHLPGARRAQYHRKAGLAPLMNLQLRAIETSNLELQLEKLEKRLARLEAARDKKSNGQLPTAWAADSQSLDG